MMSVALYIKCFDLAHLVMVAEQTLNVFDIFTSILDFKNKIFLLYCKFRHTMVQVKSAHPQFTILTEQVGVVVTRQTCVQEVPGYKLS